MSDTHAPKPPSATAPPPAAKPRARFFRQRNARRAVQVFFLLLFAYIVLGAHGVPTFEGWRLGGAINPAVVFLGDPFTWLSASLAARTVAAASVGLLVVFFVLTILFGRVFCGWVCPLGTLIDGCGPVLRPRKLEVRAARRRREAREREPLPPMLGPRTKYYLLLFFLILAGLGVNASGAMDPLAILMRGTTFALAPVGEWGFEQTAGRLSRAPVVSGPASDFYYWAKNAAFSATSQTYAQGLLHLGILLGVLGLTRLRRRYWCHVLCPLGAAWGLVARVGLWKRRVDPSACNDCGVCGLSCRMEAVGSGDLRAVDGGECLRCGECPDVCRPNAIRFAFTAPKSKTSSPGNTGSRVGAALSPEGTSSPPCAAASSGSGTPALRPDDRFRLTRRGVLGALGASVVAFPLVRLTSSARSATLGDDVPGYKDPFLIRPPGARPEAEFLQRCIRCGVCYKTCPQNALHPTLLQAGLEGLWTPAVVSRIGYCEPTCTLCTRVCPTNAIEPLTREEKPEKGRLGIAVFDRARCLPWARGEFCAVCEEMCPVSPKAIELVEIELHDYKGDRVSVMAPVIHEDRCIGCGACENKCPVEGTAAVRVARAPQGGVSGWGYGGYSGY